MKKNNLLLITNTIDLSPSGGRELLCKLNYDILKDIYQDQCIVYELEKHSISGIQGIINAFNGYIDGLTQESIRDILEILKLQNINKVFVDGSNFGQIVKCIKKSFPDVHVYTFFHNVEVRFFLGSLKQSRSLHALAVLMVNYLAEKKSIAYSDKILCINQRDNLLLKKLYGRSSTDLYPMSLEDKLPKNYENLPTNIEDKFALFVGGTFYANRTGVFWYVRHVAPHISIKTYIVGRGFEKYKSELEKNDKIVVIGEVESLAQWYHDAHFVIAPIFDGSGMKTKVAEALMYGKKIIGAPEAFTGYEDITEQAGDVCHTVDEFVSAIETSNKIVMNSFDTELRKIYEENYSYTAAKKRLEKILII